MDRKDYFKKLIGLYEAATGVMPAQQVDPQANIADSGMDVDPNAQAQAQPNPGQVEGEVPQDMAGTEEVAMPEPAPTSGSSFELDKQKQIKLFDLLRDLLNYGQIFFESINKVDISLVDAHRYETLKRYITNIQDLVEKINLYLRKLYPSDTYEKMLYTYVLYRTELLTNIQGIRSILELNNPDAKLEKSE